MKKNSLLAAAVLALTVFCLTAAPARADVAPPQPPMGANIVPGQETTRVQMLAETVTLDVRPAVQASIPAQAAVTAEFILRNLGDQAENLAVRFPLDYGVDDPFANLPDIDDLRVRVDGKRVPTRRVQEPLEAGGSPAIDWAVFDVAFPPGQEVAIEITYTADAAGFSAGSSEKTLAFRYILETGAGWNGPIGRAEIIARLPYQAGPENVLTGGGGYGAVVPDFIYAGNEIRWIFEDLEPTWESNILIPLVRLDAWGAVLKARQAADARPGDGEAWGRLGKAIKEILISHHMLRTDPGAEQLYTEARRAYERSLELLPDDGLWHFGYAELVWQHYQTLHWEAASDPAELTLALRELQLSLELAPDNERASELLCLMAGEPGILGGCRDYCSSTTTCRPEDIVYLALTATPVPPTPWAAPSETPRLTPVLILPTATVQTTNRPVPMKRPPPTVPLRTPTALALLLDTPPLPETTPTPPPVPPDRVCPPAVGLPLGLVGAAAAWRRRGGRRAPIDTRPH